MVPTPRDPVKAGQTGEADGGQAAQAPLEVGPALALEEVVQLADLIYGRAGRSNPILRFLRDGEEVEVYTGVQEGPLAGHGELIRCKKENGIWVIKSRGIWVS